MKKNKRGIFPIYLVIAACIIAACASGCSRQNISKGDAEGVICKGVTGSDHHMIWLFESKIPVALLYSYEIEGYKRYEWNEFEIGDLIYLLVDLTIDNEELALYVLTINGDKGNNIGTTRFFGDVKKIDKGMTRYSGRIRFNEETKITTWEVEKKSGEKYRLNFYVKVILKEDIIKGKLLP